MPIKRLEILLTLLTAIIDTMMIFLAFAAAYLLRSETEIIQVVYLWPFDQYQVFVAWMIPAWIVIFSLAGLYRDQLGRAPWGQFTKVFLAVSAGIMFFVVWVFLSRTLFFSRLIVIYAWILAIIFVFLGRVMIGALERFLYRFDIGTRGVIIIGQSETAERLKGELENRSELGYRVINGLVKPTAKALNEFIAGHQTVNEMIVADSQISSGRLLELMNLAEQYNIAFRLVPTLFEVRSTNVEVQTLAAVPIIAFRRTTLTGWSGVLKRTFDIIASSLALIILSPIYLLIILLVKFDSPGPIFYQHRRLGWRKKPFFLYKFRTMKKEYCTGEGFTGKTDQEIFIEELGSAELAKAFQRRQKLRNDPRVTGFGRLLRQTSLDELPQLFNVWLGDLSLVGPRPIVDAELVKYGQFKHRLFIIKPGVTGLWQVSGRSDMPYRERVKLDMYYIENWSLWSDIVILIKTFFIVLLRKNAY